MADLDIFSLEAEQVVLGSILIDADAIHQVRGILDKPETFHVERHQWIYKAILDLSRTLEYLETHGVPVIGYGTDEFPAFYSRRSGLGVDARVEAPEEVARMVQARTELGLSTALLVCAPVPEADALASAKAEAAIAQAVQEAETAGVGGKELTPFLLALLAELTSGEARRANEALLLNNARVAARIARALATSG